jgi:hypothetical protein
MRRPILIAPLLVLAACSPEFDPASLVEKLRVVAIQAEPPELDPAGVQTAALTSLVLRADFVQHPARVTTVLHLACVPDPERPWLGVPCVRFATLRDPVAEVAAIAREACRAAAGGGSPETYGWRWEPIALAGLEECVGDLCGPPAGGPAALLPPRLALPAGFSFPAPGADTSAGRILGVQAIDLAFAVDATPDELIAGIGTTCPAGDLATQLEALWATREHVLSTKRVVIRGPDAGTVADADPPNRNPAVAGIRADLVPLDPAAATSLVAGELQLTPALPAGPAGQPEIYSKRDAAGAVTERKVPEEWVYSWFATAGELKDLHTRSVTDPDRWTVGAVGSARVVVVVRDLRGGTAWTVRDVVVGR